MCYSARAKDEFREKEHIENMKTTSDCSTIFPNLHYIIIKYIFDECEKAGDATSNVCSNKHKTHAPSTVAFSNKRVPVKAYSRPFEILKQ